MRVSFVIAVAVSMVALLAAPAHASRTMSLSSKRVPPGTTVTVSGAGFTPNTRVDVFLDTADLALAVSNGAGAVKATVAIPQSAQPGQHWITLEEPLTYAAVQAPVAVAVDWAQAGWGASQRNFNPYENTVNASNVSQLTQLWSAAVTATANPKPFVVYNGYLYVFDENETLHAYLANGTSAWTAAPGANFRFSQASITAFNGLVFVGDATGLVAAYKYNCRGGGVVCPAPKWSKNIGTAVNGGLTIRRGLLMRRARTGWCTC